VTYRPLEEHFGRLSASSDSLTKRTNPTATKEAILAVRLGEGAVRWDYTCPRGTADGIAHPICPRKGERVGAGDPARLPRDLCGVRVRRVGRIFLKCSELTIRLFNF
jgi:hypothetical protein